MSIETSNEVRAETFFDEQLSDDVPCVASECESRATWALTILCPAKHGSLMCEAHRQVWMDAHAPLANRPVKVCTERGTYDVLAAPFFTWRHL